MYQYSIYIHLPFCKSRCLYCDFFSTSPNIIPFKEYAEVLRLELAARKAALPQLNRLLSVYIGGGTPSLWSAEQLGALLKELPIRGNEEITVEVNPRDACSDWFSSLVDYGVNRFSIGVQSLNDKRLEYLGRQHSVEDAVQAVRGALCSGANSVSADLIYGTYGQKPKIWKKEIVKLTDLGVTHVSAYELTIAKNTPFGMRKAEGEEISANEEIVEELYQTTLEVLSQKGFEHYEISNFALEGQRSRHNEHYWRGGEYIGLGAGAHGCSKLGNELIRYSNTQDIECYLDYKNNEQSPLNESIGGQTEYLSMIDQAKERIMLGLRTSDGIVFEKILKSIPLSMKDEWLKIARKLEKRNMVYLCEGKMIPTIAGMANADGLAEEFF